MGNKERFQSALNDLFRLFVNRIFKCGGEAKSTKMTYGQICGYVQCAEMFEHITKDQSAKLFEIVEKIEKTYWEVVDSGEEIRPPKRNKIIDKLCDFAIPEIQKVLGK